VPQRKIVQIDEEKCDGCGLCVPSCAEGAIAIRDGKARLIADVYCDGLGACLGHCPQGAISIIERDAAPFDLPQAHGPGAAAPTSGAPIVGLSLAPSAAPTSAPLPGCLSTCAPTGAGAPLVNWPIQLRLVPPNAPYLRGADLLLVADCVAFALADFHRQLVARRPVLIACPKLDDTRGYVEKLAQILDASAVHSFTVVHMSVPCCTGLLRVAEAAKKLAGCNLSLESIVVSPQGQIVTSGSATTGGCRGH
jgi:Pyruvate/2-oxoacid:ferredoxin oxidoreductase delta subunit